MNPISKSLDLDLPDLSNFAYGPVQDPGGLDASSVQSSICSVKVPETLEVEIWSFPEIEQDEQEPAKIQSWEAFYDKNFQELRTVYISEAGPQVFDAALAVKTEHDSTGKRYRDVGRVVQSGPLLNSFLQLGLGRESILYRYSEDRRSFRPNLEDVRMSGYSPEVFDSLSTSFIKHGNNARQLRSFIDETQVLGTAPPALVALTGCFSSILRSIQVQLVDEGASVRSLLHLQSLFERPGQILVLLSQISWKVGGAKTDEELVSRMYEMVADLEHTAAWLQPMLFNILSSVSKPWLETVSAWLGFKANSASMANVQSPKFALASEDFEPLAMPIFVAKEDARLIFETGQSLRLLEAHRPEHPLVKPRLVDFDEILGLRWQSSWEHLEKIQAQAREYESDLQAAIREFDTHGESTKELKGPLEDTKLDGLESTRFPGESAEAYIATSITTFQQPLPNVIPRDDVPDSVLWGIQDVGETPIKDIFPPPVALLPTLSFNPLISTQAHLVNRACVRLLLKEHNLRSHFSLLHRYSLFGDGVFASRLSHALFDPELQSSERRKGHSRAGTPGLKLGSRDTWPPASSELRLALMGILTESYHNAEQSEASSMFRAELPGGLSFAIREMSEEELQRCINPDSIEALDFLRLQYKPPPPLNAVITDLSLTKYDAVFKLLLRAVRMVFVVNHLFRDVKNFAMQVDLTAQRFRIESHHFVSAVCGYFFDGVQASWTGIDLGLEHVEKELDQDGTDGLAELRELHEQVLDRMMFTLLLRKRQGQVMKLLEEIFSLVLQFAREYRSQLGANGSKTKLQEMYEKFKKKVRVFISVCRGLSERRGQGGTKAHETIHDLLGNESTTEDGGNTISHLSLKFEISGFYVR